MSIALGIAIAIIAFVAGLFLSPKATAEVEQLKADLATAEADIKDLEDRIKELLTPAPPPAPATKVSKRKVN